MNKFENKVLLIEDNEMLEKVKNLIDKNGYNKCPTLNVISGGDYDYLYYNSFFNDFGLADKNIFEEEISFDCFEKLITENNE